MPTPVPFGSWRSPISAQMLTHAVRAFGSLGVHGDGLWWCEGRPDEDGRTTLMQRPRGAVQSRERLPAPWNARSRVHEYGGTAVAMLPDGFCFVGFADQQLYRVRGDDAPQRLTDVPHTRFADLCVDLPRARIVAVAERHHAAAADGTTAEPENLLVAIALADGRVTELLRGADFYAAPRISPDGRKLAFLQWRHPFMPWDAAQLHVASLAPDGTAGAAQSITRADDESAFQPEWLPDGRLVFACDRDGWWNPWLWDGATAGPILREQAEYGLPLWGLGSRSYCVVDARTLVAQRIVDGAAALVQVDIEHGTATPLATAWQRFGQPCSDGERVWFVGERHDRAAAIVEHDLRSGEERVLEGGTEPVDAAYLAAPERVAFTGDQGLTSWAWFYRPTHPEFAPAAGQPPPLMVLTHGGPTGATSPGLNLRIQYYTSRGWAVADVDYAGSTGYGRAYRERLRERWGIADVADVVAVVDHLAARGLVDRERVAIRGGSAGGYTTLAALAFTDRFRAGVSCYGIGDLTALARDTHKFESRYLDRLIAPWPAGEPVYRARSPIEHLDGFRCPAIFLQGGKDRVVPPNQAEAMAAALRARGIPVAHVVFPDEGHGFRNGGNVRRAMALEYAFLARIFGFTPADPPEPLHIDNLDDNPGDNLDDTENRE